MIIREVCKIAPLSCAYLRRATITLRTFRLIYHEKAKGWGGGGKGKRGLHYYTIRETYANWFHDFFCNALWKISSNTTKPTILRQKIILIHSLPFISKSCWQVHCSDQFCFLHPSWKVKFKGTKQYSKIKKGHLLVRTPFNVKCMLKSIRVWSVLTTLSISPTLKHSSYTHCTNDSQDNPTAWRSQCGRANGKR